jgi:hypothetical protein
VHDVSLFDGPIDVLASLPRPFTSIHTYVVISVKTCREGESIRSPETGADWKA